MAAGPARASGTRAALGRRSPSIPPDEDDPLYVEALGALARATAFTGAVDEAERIGDRAVDARPRASAIRVVLASVLRSTVSMTLRPTGDREAAGTRDRAARA